MTLQTLIYCSRPIGLRREDVYAILASSERNNAAADVTGVLLFDQDHVVQVLEGGRLAVCATFARILNDPRHQDVRIVSCVDARARMFAAWRMRHISRREADQVDLLRFSPSRTFAPEAMTGDALLGLCVELSRQAA